MVTSLSVLLAAVALVITPPATHAGWEDGDNAEVLQSNYDLTWIGSAPDRASGMLVAAIDHSPTPDRVVVNRINHNGSEVWGDDGVYLPITIGRGDF